MPRHSDPQLEERILSTADHLWHKGGEKALTMRAVARAAGTTTPTLYQRFPGRDRILRALVRRSQQRLLAEIEPSQSLEEVCQRVLDHVLAFPYEYELLTSDLVTRLNEPRPSLEFVLRRTAEWFGGRPEDHYSLIVALWSLLQGTVMLLKTLPAEQAGIIRSSLAVSVRILIRNRSQFSSNR